MGSNSPHERLEANLLQQFRQFAEIEKQRVFARRKAQALQDRTAELNRLMRFSKTFKLKYPVPNGLAGTLVTDEQTQKSSTENQMANLRLHTKDEEMLQVSLLPALVNTVRVQVPASSNAVAATMTGCLEILQSDMRWTSRFFILHSR